MKIITLKIQNGYNTSKNISILNTLLFTKDNFGLPKKINISVNNSFEKDADNYAKLLCYIMQCPFMCKVISSTNNRQLSFYDKDIWSKELPMEPSLDIDGNPREKKFFEVAIPDSDETETDWEYVKKWNPRKLLAIDLNILNKVNYKHLKQWNNFYYIFLAILFYKTITLEFVKKKKRLRAYVIAFTIA